MQSSAGFLLYPFLHVRAYLLTHNMQQNVQILHLLILAATGLLFFLVPLLRKIQNKASCQPLIFFCFFNRSGFTYSKEK